MPRLLLLALVALALPAAGTAAFPGTNGRILFTQQLQPIGRFDAAERLRLRNRAERCATDEGGRAAARAVDRRTRPSTRPHDRVAYSRIGDIFISGVDGGGQRFLADGTMPAWTPDGRRLYYANGGDLYSIGDAMESMTRFTSGPRYDQMAGRLARRTHRRVRPWIGTPLGRRARAEGAS